MRSCWRRRDWMGSAFAVFYDRYEAAVVGYFARRVRDPEVVADLAAEVFAAALEAAPRYRPSQPSAVGWLFAIAQNTLANSLRGLRVEARARRRIGIRDAAAFEDDELDRVEALATGDTWLSSLLARLSPEQADAIRARVLEERGYPEIAAELGTSAGDPQAVRHGLAALKHDLEQENRR